MPGRGSKLAIAAASFVVAALAPSQAAAKLDAGDIAAAKLRTKSFATSGQQSVGGTVRCRRGTRVLMGGAYWHRRGKPPRSTYSEGFPSISASRPSVDQRSWYAHGEGRANLVLTIAVRCASARLLSGASVFTADEFPPDGDPAGGAVTCSRNHRAFTGGASWTENFEDERPMDASRALLASSSLARNGRGWYADGTDNWITLPPELRLAWTVHCLPDRRFGRIATRARSFEAADDEAVGGRVRCPRGSRALTGGATWHPPGSPPSPSSNEGIFGGSNGFLAGNRAWYANGLNFNAGGSGGPRVLTVRVLCLKR